METLFPLTIEELSQISLDAEFNENNQFVINESNCIHKKGIIIFKKPIRVLYGNFMCDITDTRAIIKEDRNSNFVYMFAMTEIKSEKTSDALYDFYVSDNGFKNGCRCINTHSKGWEPGYRVWEVSDEIL